MGAFTTIFNHYFKRSLRNKMNYLMIAIPLGIILLNVAVAYNNIEEGVRLADLPFMVVLVALMTLSFQFFCSEILTEFLNLDIRGEVKWRLLVSPVQKSTYLMAIAAVSFIVSMLMGIVVFLVMLIGFRIDFGGVHIWISVLTLMALVGHACAVVIVLLAPSKKAASAISMIFAFAMMGVAGALPIPVNILPDFIRTYNPVTLGTEAIVEGGALAVQNMGLLLAMFVGISVVAFVINRRVKI